MLAPQRRRLLLELLEDRAVPATVSAAMGVFTVTGTSASEIINVRQSTGIVSVDGLGSYTTSGLTQVVVKAQGGDDTVSLIGAGLPVTVFGGDGNDTLTGSVGNDRLFGENGNDRLTGNAGNDLLYGGNGNDIIDSGAGNDSLYGDHGDDWLSGSSGDDQLYGGGGRDTLTGGDGVDRYQDDYTIPLNDTVVLRGITARHGAETVDALPDDVDQALGYTCSFLSALSSFARNRPDVASRITYDRANNQYRVPMFVNDHWVNVGIGFNGSWTDNDPTPSASMADGRRDYWPIIYQRAYLKALNVNSTSSNAAQWSVAGTAPHQLTLQNWRYPAIALTTLTGRPSTIDTVLTDSDKQLLINALHSGRDVIANTSTLEYRRAATQAAGLVFAHTYTVVNVVSDASGGFVVLRNPWGVDAPAGALNSWSITDRTYFTLGNENDGYVRLRWNKFKEMFPSVVAA